MDAGTAHLLEASIKLECSLEVTARGLLLYHHFMRCSAETRYDVDMVAAVALSLSARLYEQPIDFDSLICVFYSIVNQTRDVMSSEDVAYGLIKNTLSYVDCMMMRLLEFDLNHRLAYQRLFGQDMALYLAKAGVIYRKQSFFAYKCDFLALEKFLKPFLTMIFERSKYIADFRAELGRTCIRFMSDFYTQPKCLEFSPELIAVASIDLALYVHGLLNDLAMVPAWYMGLTCDATPDRVKIIKRIILNLYEKKWIITPPQLAPTQLQQVVSTQLQQVVSTQLQQVVSTQLQQVVSSQLQVVTTQPQQGAPTQAVPLQGQQTQVIESQLRQVVQYPPLVVPYQVKKVFPAEVVQIEDMDISP